MKQKPKTLTALLLCVLMAIGFLAVLAGCGSSGQNDAASGSEIEEKTKTESAKTIDGGWEMSSNKSAALPKDVQTAFDKATEKFTGSDLKPVAYIAEQVVAGKNYMLLCEATPTTAEPQSKYQMAVIYADLDGNAEITSIKDFELNKYLDTSGEQKEQEELAGGWNVPKETAGSAIPANAQAAFDKAVKTFTGSTIEPIALLQTQVVAGTNYAFICRSTPAVQNPVPVIQIVKVYEDLESNAEISNICTIDPADYNG